MAKSIVLYGVFLGAVVCFCNYFSGVGVSSDQLSVISDQPGAGGAEDEGTGDEWSVMGEGMNGGGWSVMGDGVSEVRGTGFELRGAESGVIGRPGDELRDKIKQIYSGEIGVREKTGKNDGKRVEEYLAITQLGSGYAWCAAFVSWVFAEAGFLQPRTPWSPSLFPKDRVIWERGNVVRGAFEVRGSGDELRLKPNTPYLKPNRPEPADVFGIYFANLKRIAHVGFVDEWGEKYVITIEGVRP